MKAEKNQVNFKGTIQTICLSPHGLPDGFFLDDGQFVDLHPHELQDAKGIEVGAKVSGTGHLGPDKMIGGAKVMRDGKTLSAKVEIDEAEDSVEGTVVNFLKEGPHVTALFLDGNITVHLPKHEHIKEEDLGGYVKVDGMLRTFLTGSFMKAKKVKWLH